MPAAPVRRSLGFAYFTDHFGAAFAEALLAALRERCPAWPGWCASAWAFVPAAWNISTNRLWC